MDENAAQIKALKRQTEIVMQLVEQGYRMPHAQGIAKLWAPTPAQQRMRIARQKKGKKNGKDQGRARGNGPQNDAERPASRPSN